MPKAYEKMKAQFKSKGMSEDQAQTQAAKIYNSKRKAGKKAVSGSKAYGQRGR